MAQSATPPAAPSPSNIDNTDSIAVVIGNKAYSNTISVEYAENDAAAMKSWLINALGFQEQNIIFKVNATLGDFFNTFGRDDDPQGDLMRRVTPGRSNVFVFYSGHGAPDIRAPAARDAEAYLIPTDVSPERAWNGYARDLLMRNLQAVRQKIGPNRWLVVMLDACFSGNSAGGALLRVSKGTFTPKPLGAAKDMVRVMATRSSQLANWDRDLHLGLMTGRFLLGATGTLAPKEGIDVRNGSIGWKPLAAYVERSVVTASRVNGVSEQDPQIDGDLDVEIKPFVVPQLVKTVATMADGTAWQKAKAVDSAAAYKAYLVQCTAQPEGACLFKADAERRIDDFLWEATGDETYLSACVRKRTGCFHKNQIALPAPVPPPPPKPAPPVVAAPSNNDAAAQAWAATKDTTSIAILEAFIQEFGATVYGTMARARLVELKASKTATVAPPRSDTGPPPRRPEYMPTPPPPPPMLLSSAAGRWAIGDASNCGVPSKTYDLTVMQRRIVWRNGVGSTDVESIVYSAETEFRTTTVYSTHASGPNVAPGSIWIYQEAGFDRMRARQAGRAPFRLARCQ